MLSICVSFCLAWSLAMVIPLANAWAGLERAPHDSEVRACACMSREAKSGEPCIVFLCVLRMALRIGRLKLESPTTEFILNGLSSTGMYKDTVVHRLSGRARLCVCIRVTHCGFSCENIALSHLVVDPRVLPVPTLRGLGPLPLRLSEAFSLLYLLPRLTLTQVSRGTSQGRSQATHDLVTGGLGTGGSEHGQISNSFGSHKRFPSASVCAFLDFSLLAVK